MSAAGRGRHLRSLVGAVGALAMLTLGAAACGGPAGRGAQGGSSSAVPGPAPRRSGTAQVAYAGSLQKVDDQVVGPAFTRTTGYAYSGRGGGSLAVAHEILAGEITPGVFESVGSAPIASLGSRARWWAQLASSPLVIAYNPSAPDAAVFRAARAGDPASLRRVFEAMASPGFRLGRTNPATDPQGQAFVMMVELAQRVLGLPAGTVDRILGKGATSGGGNTSQIFAETSLDATLQSGQLDAGSAFLSQAVQLHLPYIALPTSIDFGQPADAATYATASVTVPGATAGTTVTVHGSPLVVDVTTVAEPSASSADRAAADAFAAYLLSAAGRRAYAAGGYTLLPEVLHGSRSAVPASIRSVIARNGPGSSTA